MMLGAYPYQMVPVEALLQTELRGMRKLLGIGASEVVTVPHIEATMKLCTDFIFRGVLLVVKVSV
jgi:hypothetical protein